jgi:hypothetical protein
VLVAVAPAVAKDRSMEFDSLSFTIVFDLSPMQVLQLGKSPVTYVGRGGASR